VNVDTKVDTNFFARGNPSESESGSRVSATALKFGLHTMASHVYEQSTRNWRAVMEEIFKTKSGETAARFERAIN
jgi:hypothetical protein